MAGAKALTDRVESFGDLVSYLESGCKPEDTWRIGTEHEKFGYHRSSLAPLQYDGEDGVRAMLEGLQRFGWEPIIESGFIIGLKLNGANISLEPGGQFELSGAPLETLHQTCDEVHTHLHQVKVVADELGLGFLGIGFSPKWTLDETPIMPKERYKIMRAYMQKVGTLGREMMFRSCTVQVNLDFSSEADMVKKFRVALALQPIATALFANSPFTEGKPNGFVSYRSHVWTDTDPARTGMLPFVFDQGFGFESYADYALDVPMYFVKRDKKYINVTGQSFRDFMQGKLVGLEGETPFLSDWDDHLTTIFPEARLKRFLEMRGADGGPWKRLCALPALWVGLFYAQSSLDQAWNIVKDWSAEERQALRERVPVEGLAATIRNRKVEEIAAEVLDLAYAGLSERARLNGSGENETGFLETLQQILDEKITPAQKLLHKYHNEWDEDIDRVFEETSF